jgi:hypothetical protein
VVSRRLARALAVTALAGILAACSLTRVAYNNASFALVWAVDDWFELNEGQRGWVRDRLDQLLSWHRANELPEYRRFLQETAERASSRVTGEDARWAYREFRVLYRRSMEQLIPDMADFLLQLEPAQLARLERRFAESNAKAEKESLAGTPEERRERRAQRFIEQAEDWVGPLAVAQRELVRSRVLAMTDIAAEWMADRRLRQAETLALARAKPPRARMAEGLRRLLIDTDAWRRPQYVEQLKERDEHVFALVGALGTTLTPEQRAQASRRVRGYAADVAYLMAAF